MFLDVLRFADMKSCLYVYHNVNYKSLYRRFMRRKFIMFYKPLSVHCVDVDYGRKRLNAPLF